MLPNRSVAWSGKHSKPIQKGFFCYHFRKRCNLHMHLKKCHWAYPKMSCCLTQLPNKEVKCLLFIRTTLLRMLHLMFGYGHVFWVRRRVEGLPLHLQLYTIEQFLSHSCSLQSLHMSLALLLLLQLSVSTTHFMERIHYDLVGSNNRSCLVRLVYTSQSRITTAQPTFGYATYFGYHGTYLFWNDDFPQL